MDVYMNNLIKLVLVKYMALIMVFSAVVVNAGEATTTLSVGEDILKSPDRTPGFVDRDIYRHPAETLAFFDVQPTMSVVEIWPGGGWYTEILAPYLNEGTLYAAHFPADSSVKYFTDSRRSYEEKLKAYPELYQAVILTEFSPDTARLNVPDGSADRVLTFRNVHNWLRSNDEAQAFALFFKALKPGGMLGVVEHRARPGTDWQTMKESGYMTEAYVISLAEKAGFILDARSEINANPRDTSDHPKGVWTLPPTLRLNDVDREKYLAIGESDRMTLRFRKPVL
jgi:predicted methyltransferase